jgi:hypothetical protein
VLYNPFYKKEMDDDDRDNMINNLHQHDDVNHVEEGVESVEENGHMTTNNDVSMKNDPVPILAVVNSTDTVDEIGVKETSKSIVGQLPLTTSSSEPSLEESLISAAVTTTSSSTTIVSDPIITAPPPPPTTTDESSTTNVPSQISEEVPALTSTTSLLESLPIQSNLITAPEIIISATTTTTTEPTLSVNPSTLSVTEELTTSPVQQQQQSSEQQPPSQQKPPPKLHWKTQRRLAALALAAANGETSTTTPQPQPKERATTRTLPPPTSPRRALRLSTVKQPLSTTTTIMEMEGLPPSKKSYPKKIWKNDFEENSTSDDIPPPSKKTKTSTNNNNNITSKRLRTSSSESRTTTISPTTEQSSKINHTHNGISTFNNNNFLTTKSSSTKTSIKTTPPPPSLPVSSSSSLSQSTTIKSTRNLSSNVVTINENDTSNNEILHVRDILKLIKQLLLVPVVVASNSADVGDFSSSNDNKISCQREFTRESLEQELCEKLDSSQVSLYRAIISVLITLGIIVIVKNPSNSDDILQWRSDQDDVIQHIDDYTHALILLKQHSYGLDQELNMLEREVNHKRGSGKSSSSSSSSSLKNNLQHLPAVWLTSSPIAIRQNRHLAIARVREMQRACSRINRDGLEEIFGHVMPINEGPLGHVHSASTTMLELPPPIHTLETVPRRNIGCQHEPEACDNSDIAIPGYELLCDTKPINFSEIAAEFEIWTGGDESTDFQRNIGASPRPTPRPSPRPTSSSSLIGMNTTISSSSNTLISMLTSPRRIGSDIISRSPSAQELTSPTSATTSSNTMEFLLPWSRAVSGSSLPSSPPASLSVINMNGPSSSSLTLPLESQGGGGGGKQQQQQLSPPPPPTNIIMLSPINSHINSINASPRNQSPEILVPRWQFIDSMDTNVMFNDNSSNLNITTDITLVNENENAEALAELEYQRDDVLLARHDQALIESKLKFEQDMLKERRRRPPYHGSSSHGSNNHVGSSTTGEGLSKKSKLSTPSVATTITSTISAVNTNSNTTATTATTIQLPDPETSTDESNKRTRGRPSLASRGYRVPPLRISIRRGYYRNGKQRGSASQAMAAAGMTREEMVVGMTTTTTTVTEQQDELEQQQQQQQDEQEEYQLEQQQQNELEQQQQQQQDEQEEYQLEQQQQQDQQEEQQQQQQQ